MPSKRTLLFSTAIIITAGLCIEGLLCSLLFFTRASFIQWVLQLTHRPYLQGILENSIITPHKFMLLRGVCIALLVVMPAVVFILYRFRIKVIGSIKFTAYCFTSAFASVKKIFTRNTNGTNIAFLIVLLVIAIKAVYYIIHFDLQYDEMWSYNYFTSKPFYLSFFTYNNYPLYELSTQLFKWLPFSMQVNLRLPCVLAGLGTCVILYACIKNYTGNALTALAGMAAFACMPVTVFYMLYARGVIFEMLFAVISIFCILYMLNGAAVKKYTVLFVVANIAGLYSMPTHIYFMLLQLLLVTAYVLLYKKPLLTSFLCGNAAAILVGLICYLPVIAGSGASFLLNAAPYPAFATRNIAGIILYTGNSSIFFTGYKFGFAVLMAVTILAVLIFKKNNRQVIFLIVSMLLLAYLPVLIYLVQGLAVSERAVAFTGLAIPFSICLLFYTLKNSFTPYAMGVALASLFVLGSAVSHKHEFLNWSIPEDKKAITISNLLMQHHVTSCYDSTTTGRFYYFYPALEYYYGRHQQNIQLFMPATTSLRYKPFNENDKYDCVIKNIGSGDTTSAGKYTVVYMDKEEGFSILLRAAGRAEKE